MIGADVGRAQQAPANALPTVAVGVKRRGLKTCRSERSVIRSGDVLVSVSSQKATGKSPLHEIAALAGLLLRHLVMKRGRTRSGGETQPAVSKFRRNLGRPASIRREGEDAACSLDA